MVLPVLVVLLVFVVLLVHGSDIIATGIGAWVHAWDARALCRAIRGRARTLPLFLAALAVDQGSLCCSTGGDGGLQKSSRFAALQRMGVLPDMEHILCSRAALLQRLRLTATPPAAVRLLSWHHKTQLAHISPAAAAPKGDRNPACSRRPAVFLVLHFFCLLTTCRCSARG